MSKADDHILSKLPAKLKLARQQKSLSLDVVAKLSGVSKSMLSQIERGTSNPTISTLWNLTQALQVDFAGLLEGDSAQSKITVLRADDVPTITVQGAGCQIRILSPPQDAGVLEVYELIFKARDILNSQPHSAGAREHLTVTEGRLTLKSGDSTELLTAGDTARYPADVPHSITGETKAKAILIVKNS